jgi:hypothetical protein
MTTVGFNPVLWARSTQCAISQSHDLGRECERIAASRPIKAELICLEGETAHFVRFLATGMEHSPTSATGTGWERTPWHATQRAAWEALKKAETG